MKEILNEFWLNNGVEIIQAILTVVITLILATVKKVYEKYANTETKKDIVRETVRYVEQISKRIEITDKFQKAKDIIIEQLAKCGIDYNDIELEVMIESAVNKFFGKNESEEEFKAEGSE